MKIDDYKKRVFKTANLKVNIIAIFAIIIMIGILAIFLITGNPEYSVYILILIGIFSLILLVGVWKQLYYSFLHKINDDDQVVDLAIKPYKISLKPYFDRGLFSKYGSSYLGVRILYRIDDKKYQLIYPFMKQDLSLYPENRYKVYHEISNKLFQIENLKLSYLSNSKVIIDSTINIENMVFKIVNSCFK
ncbi:MAG: hypothetical protein A2Y45_06230 [Tenericutes bacterium GWC2_34_14]|nr:MAG: hypothetical protein A2Y45_06230 [Tenericutes bacterium GWC2_34_14]OHE33540.1 MAG: hypothetical protein A2012_03580 [Tenericutes bacterium GWE2_34_108]OHE36825.1 MAG: hypothetical protein A2Y46_09380 [Tenericutes bacterium GWF1_35_14]OHE38095.1 MAG: hypothetical protein A2Y44_09285 [Tenericutes bacterium GWF2_35_184]OHE43388.1 MAG: hypothetical protein A2221_06450 [Tenericutes bacterium RIFOXYA2_FULL_36_32]OHE45165.1 MAG: hypothetical protein A3K26_05635 [Tenericutes bacterium RIFOXYA1